MDAVLDNAVTRCPFLARVAAAEGPEFAKRIAINPTLPASAGGAAQRRPVLEELSDYSTTFRLYHGAGGVVPLAHIGGGTGGSSPSEKVLVEQHPSPSFAPLQQQQSLQPARLVVTAKQQQQEAPRPSSIHGLGKGLGGGGCPGKKGSTRPLPLATMSMSFGNMPDFGHFLKALQQQHNQAKQHVRRVQQPNNSSSTGQPRAGGSGMSPGSASAAPAAGGEPGSGGLCPMRKMLGPLAPLVFNPKGHLQCPEAIVRARAALAATKPVRELRPQALPIKLLAVGATTAAVNVPCGMAREHTEKFSFGWFVAVHASIPFIAMLRKAVIMPKYAILFTIATAIAGQAMGARLERRRMQHAAAEAALQPTAAVAAAPIHPSAGVVSHTPAKLVVSKVRLAAATSSATPPPALALANTTASHLYKHTARRNSASAQLAPQGIAQAADSLKLLLGTEGAAAAAAGPATSSFSIGRSTPRATKSIVLRSGGAAGRGVLGRAAAPALLEARA